MTWLEFVASIIDNIFSWPVAALLVVLILRRQLAELFRTVESFVLEAGGARFAFNRGLERAREGINEARAAAPPDSEGEAYTDQSEASAVKHNPYLVSQYMHITALAERTPDYAVEVAWERLIAEQIRRLAHDRGIPPADTMSQLSELNYRRIVGDAVMDSILRLNEIRAKATLSGVNLTTGTALEYTQLAWEVAVYLDSLHEKDTQLSDPE